MQKAKLDLVRPEGLEPPTTWFEARYSIQLSYRRELDSKGLHRNSLICLSQFVGILRKLSIAYTLWAWQKTPIQICSRQICVGIICALLKFAH